jgi:PPM family protein phosphatase
VIALFRRRSQEKLLEISYLTHKGMVREFNEDGLFVDEQMGLFMVADGMGGHNAGEVASAMAVTEISQFVRAGMDLGKNSETLLREAFFAAHEVVLALSLSDDSLNDMGTTVVAVILANGQVTVGHVGDSRAYEIHEGRITKLTHDHSFIADWIRDGLINHAESRTHNARHGLTMALGVDDDMEPEIKSFPWLATSCLLLCSDGLTDMVDDEEILSVVENASSLKAACRKLVAKANEKGGEDNITVVLVRK